MKRWAPFSAALPAGRFSPTFLGLDVKGRAGPGDIGMPRVHPAAPPENPVIFPLIQVREKV
jgi:hypothetical protein